MKSVPDFTFTDLVDSKEFQELHKIVTDFTGVTMCVADVEGKETSPCSLSTFNHVCRIIRTTQEGCSRCYANDFTHLNQVAVDKRKSYQTCHAGMIDFLVPITSQNEMIGFISCGQVFPKPPTEEGFAELCERLADLNLDEEALREAYYQNPHMSQEKIELLLKLLSFMSEYFCEVGVRLRKIERYPEIAKAKNFIHSQFREPISLMMVADHVLLSKTYFSRLFKRVVGTTFSEYLQALRLEEAKKLLIRTDWSISQIALSAGFSNLSYFNQFFRKIEECTPRQYRTEYAVKGRPKN